MLVAKEDVLKIKYIVRYVEVFYNTSFLSKRDQHTLGIGSPVGTST
jgi:hypothetical protein